MGRARKDNKVVTFSISNDAVKDLEFMSNTTRLSKSDIVDMAVKRYVEEYKSDNTIILQNIGQRN